MTDERHHPGDGHESDELSEMGDDSLSRIIRELRAEPAIDPAAKARVLVAVAMERSHESRAFARHRSPVRIAAFVAGAAALVTVVVLSPWGMRESRRALVNVADRSAPTSGAGTSATTQEAAFARSASANADAVMVPVQLVVRAPTAKHVAVVGDFTGWDEGRIAMTRDAASGLWSATISVRPGRHVYAFVADDSVWMRDPRAPLATDSDFGRPGSVLLVGRP